MLKNWPLVKKSTFYHTIIMKLCEKNKRILFSPMQQNNALSDARKSSGIHTNPEICSRTQKEENTRNPLNSENLMWFFYVTVRGPKYIYWILSASFIVARTVHECFGLAFKTIFALIFSLKNLILGLARVFFTVPYTVRWVDFE